MASYKSSIKSVHARVQAVYGFLSDLSNLQPFAAQIPQDKVKNLSFNRDAVSFEVDSIGLVTILVTNRVECQEIEFGADKLPMPIALKIKMESKDVYLTELQIVMEAEIPFFLKPMVGNKLGDGLERFVEMLAMLPYEQLANK